MSGELYLPTELASVSLQELTMDHVDAFVEAYTPLVHEQGSRIRLGNKQPEDVAFAHATAFIINESVQNLGIWEDDTLTGAIGFTRSKLFDPEIGYWLNPEHRGRGLATIAVRALTAHVLSTHDKVKAVVDDPNNTASMNVLRRAGYTEVGMHRGKTIFRIRASQIKTTGRMSSRSSI